MKQILLDDEDALTLRRLIAVAFFKKVVRSYIKSKDESLTYVHSYLEDFFTEHSEIKRNKLAPLNIYLLKLLNVKQDIVRRPSLLSRYSWIPTYFVLPTMDARKNFAFIRDKKFNELRDLYRKSKMDAILKDSENIPIKRFAGLVESLSQTYFSNSEKLLDDGFLQYLTSTKIRETGEKYFKVMEPSFKAFFGPLLNGQFDQMAGREKIIGYYNNRNPYYLKLFLFLGAFCHSGDTFLSRLL